MYDRSRPCFFEKWSAFTITRASDDEFCTDSYTFFGNNIRAKFQKLVHRTIESGSGFLHFSVQLSLESSRGIGSIQIFNMAKINRGENVYLSNH